MRIRMQRMGRKNWPHYRIVVADSRSPRDGRHIEKLGWYNPVARRGDGLKEMSLNFSRAKYWMARGAQPSERVRWLLSQVRVLPPQPHRPFTKRHLPRKLRKELEAEIADAVRGSS